MAIGRRMLETMTRPLLCWRWLLLMVVPLMTWKRMMGITQASSHNTTGCGGEFNSTRGVIQHPMNGGNYQNNENCSWIIRASNTINITFVNFNTESKLDYLYVWDGKSNELHALGKFTGDNIPSSVKTSTNVAHLRFTSDDTITNTGFELHWQSIATCVLTTCGTNMKCEDDDGTAEAVCSCNDNYIPKGDGCVGCGGEFNSTRGVIQHPMNGGNYQNNENCSWIIRASNTINIAFVNFNTENKLDYLYIWDGESEGSHLLGSFTGNNIPPSIKTSTNVTHLYFTSDNDITGTGFELHWQSIGCVVEDGFFKAPESDQCFKVFFNASGNWEDADSKCKMEGLLLAKPKDAPALRKYLVTTYGDSHYWLGGHADGSVMRWQRDGEELPSSSPLWWPGHPGSFLKKTHCLWMLGRDSHVRRNPERPYSSASCLEYSFNPLCEVIMG